QRQDDEGIKHEGSRSGGDKHIAERNREGVGTEEKSSDQIGKTAKGMRREAGNCGPQKEEHGEAAREPDGREQIGRRESADDDVSGHHAVSREGQHDRSDSEGEPPTQCRVVTTSRVASGMDESVKGSQPRPRSLPSKPPGQEYALTM